MESGAYRQWTPLGRALSAMGDQWKLLIVLDLAAGPLRMSLLKDQLPGISTGVLDQRVRQMVALGLISRQRFREVPPRVELELTDRGRELLPVAAELACWGMRNLWSAPDPRERVEAAAFLRQLPALLEGRPDLPGGTLETVIRSDGGPVRHWFRVETEGMQAIHEPSEPVTTSIAGDQAAWTAAVGPAADYGGLDFTGDRLLGERVLDSLPGRT